MRFVDEAVIELRAGRGGHGCASFRREKYVPRGGPDGGDGGHGGSVIFEADPNRATLLDQHYRRLYRAENGRDGSSKQQTGRGGEDLVVTVPVGTLVFDDETGEQLADLAGPGARFKAAAGGRGGRGNTHFTSATRQAPRHAQEGRPGEQRRVRLELKLLADVGIIGLPNAGKSTLIRRLSASRARVGDYPFTTLVPNLGVVSAGDDSFVVADVPGLIEGAGDGAGLGHRFLRHVERAKILLHLVACGEGRDPEADYRTIERELNQYSSTLAEKERVVVLSKCDLLARDDREPVRAALAKVAGEVAMISAHSGDGIEPLVYLLAARLRSAGGPDVAGVTPNS